MRYRTIEIEEFFTDKEKTREIIDLMENNGSHLKVVYLKKHEELEAHMSNNDTCIYVTDGEIELTFPHDETCGCNTCGCDLSNEDEENSKKYKVKKEQMFFFEKDVVHSVKALKDSSFLLIKI